jgi:hypothetical protein
MKSAAKRVLGNKKKPVVKIKSKRGKTKIKLKIKAASPEGMATAVSKLAKGFKDNG